MNRIARFLVYVALMPQILSCFQDKGDEDEPYQPVELFAPAYQALGDAITEGDESYNLDATIRIIRALDMATTETDNFEDYMNFLAQQDYRYVASDVLEAQRRLFPVLQKMYKLQQENGKFDEIWMIVGTAEQSLGDLGLAFLTNFDINLALLKLPGVVNNAFDNYAKAQKLKEKNQEELDRVKEEYLEALKENWPVFMKYREVWEKLCIKKDHAYLDVYDGRNESAYNLANEILDVYPDDRDALLIKAMALAGMDNFGPSQRMEAINALDKYIDRYPTRTAPSYMVKGIIAARDGDKDTAFSNFQHAEIEYPRQAAALTDMLDAYINRPYFSKTHEGLFFYQLYKSTLEGYGVFSPNFQKAIYYENNGNRAAATREVYDHFFRRGNQAVHDYLLSDMEFCDKHLKDVMTSSFPESEKLTLTTVEKRPLVGKNHLEITLANNSNKAIQNVRVFVCYHVVGMYPGDYSVEALPAINTIAPDSKYTWESRAYTGDEIVYTRAIVVTDNRICWVNSPEYRPDTIGEWQDTISVPKVKEPVRLPPAE